MSSCDCEHAAAAPFTATLTGARSPANVFSHGKTSFVLVLNSAGCAIDAYCVKICVYSPAVCFVATDKCSLLLSFVVCIQKNTCNSMDFLTDFKLNFIRAYFIFFFFFFFIYFFFLSLNSFLSAFASAAWYGMQFFLLLLRGLFVCRVALVCDMHLPLLLLSHMHYVISFLIKITQLFFRKILTKK